MNVLIEIKKKQPNAFKLHSTEVESEFDAARSAETLVENFAGMNLTVDGAFPPIPMFSEDNSMPVGSKSPFKDFSKSSVSHDLASTSMVIAADVPASNLDKLSRKKDVTVWPNSKITLFSEQTPHDGIANDEADSYSDALDNENAISNASSGTNIDCRPFRPGVSISTIRALLGTASAWGDGFRGQNVIVGIIDEGVSGSYPVVGGYSNPNSQRPGTAHITSHGSMCAADVLIASPAAKIYDYPFLGVPNSGGALAMFQAVLAQRRIDGTPHITNNSYGFVGVPPKASSPNHEVHNINHPLHRKVREVIASGAPCFFAAGNCGSNCPSAACHISGVGAGKSIHASNSLEEVITVAAVNSRHERIGYSSQGPGLFATEKPDIASYSHIFANFGPGRPGGTSQPYDNGTSAATPVAAGVAALLMSAHPSLSPSDLKSLLTSTATDLGIQGSDYETGHGVINAGVAYAKLKPQLFHA